MPNDQPAAPSSPILPFACRDDCRPGRFPVDSALLRAVEPVLRDRGRLYWVVGGSCTGKTTVCRAISAACGIAVYDMDAHIFEDYPGRCNAGRHPALSAWFGAPDPFAWLLGLPSGEFVEFGRASTVEYLDLLAGDLQSIPDDQALLVDGGITNPALLARALPPAQIACLEVSQQDSARMWETSPERTAMKEMALGLPDPEAAWVTFLQLDALISATIIAECRQGGIQIFSRGDGSSVETLAGLVANHLKIQNRNTGASFPWGSTS